MKKILITFIAITCVTLSMSAQTEKGKFIISGSTAADLSYVSEDIIGDSGGDIKLNLNISPAVGYFVIDNLVIGAQASFAYLDSDLNDKSTQFTFMPTAQYYLPFGSVLRPSIQVGAGYVNLSQSVPISNNSTSRHSFGGFTWATAVGLSYFINNSISLDLGVQYADINASYSGNTSVKVKTKGIGGTIGISLYL